LQQPSLHSEKELPDFPFRIRLDEADNNAPAALAAVESSSTMPQVASAFSKSVEHYRFMSSRPNIPSQHFDPFIVSIDSVISGFVSSRRNLWSFNCNLSCKQVRFVLIAAKLGIRPIMAEECIRQSWPLIIPANG
jgi:hypothetical protein